MGCQAMLIKSSPAKIVNFAALPVVKSKLIILLFEPLFDFHVLL